VLTIIKLWLEDYWHDFDSELVGLLKEFLRYAVPERSHALLKSIHDTLEKRVLLYLSLSLSSLLLSLMSFSVSI